MLHYRFEAEFCNPNAGNEKGSVENKVGYIRRNAFVPIPTITSFEEFNEQLFKWCEKDAKREHYIHQVPIEELWIKDKAQLLNLPAYPFEVFRYEIVVTNKLGFAVIDTNKYGLSPIFAGEKVQAKIYSERVEFFHEHKQIGTFERNYGKNEEIFDWTQYISLMCKKPRAAANTRFFKQMPQMLQDYINSTSKKERKDALQLVKEIISDGNSALCDETFTFAKETGRTDLDSLRQWYYFITNRESYPNPIYVTSLEVPTFNYQPSLEVYDGLLKECK